jgi:SAM-dependent methyltransferase
MSEPNNTISSWKGIPLSDYEAHMSHELVGQLQLQNRLIRKYLELTKPNCFLYAGVTGGNGLEHIDKEITNEVHCVDINQKYLDITKQRFSGIVQGLYLHCIDIRRKPAVICRSDLIWASLVLEYTGVKESLRLFSMNIKPGGHLLITIQADHGYHSISETGIQSIKKLEGCFTLVDPEFLKDELGRNGFGIFGEEENFLESRKSLKTFHFRKEN